MSPAPTVAVVVASRNRAQSLGRLLDALARQRDAEFETLVVDDHSTDETPATLAAAGVRTIRLDRQRGPAGARNAGWRATDADVVAMIDDDCVPSERWLAELIAATGPRAFAQGPTTPDPAQLDRRDPWSRTQNVTGLGPFFQTCNIAYPRALLEEVGGFDESYDHFGEDTDLAWRAIAKGWEPCWAPGAAIHHDVNSRTRRQAIKDTQRWADSVRVIARHPQVRSSFVHGVFWKETHRRLLPALAGIGLAPFTYGASLLLGGWYALAYDGWYDSRLRLAAELPAHFVFDLGELIAMLRGSLRFRTFVL